jgi:hypothetical protein
VAVAEEAVVVAADLTASCAATAEYRAAFSPIQELGVTRTFGTFGGMAIEHSQQQKGKARR